LKAYSCFDKQVFDKVDLGLFRDLKEFAATNSSRSAEKKIRGLAESWSGSLQGVPSLLEALQSTEGITMSEATLVALADMKGFVHKAFAGVIKDPLATSLLPTAITFGMPCMLCCGPII
jgi:hypothetical protein